MGNVRDILSLMHQFTPQAQKVAMGFARKMKPHLDKPYAFIGIPQALSQAGQLGNIEREMKSNRYLAENLYYIFARHCKEIKINKRQDFIRYSENIFTKVANLQRYDQVKPIIQNKDKIIDFIETELKDQRLAKKFKKASSPTEIQNLMSELWSKYLAPTMGTEEDAIGMLYKGSLECFQSVYKDNLMKGDNSFAFWKMILPEVKDERVIEITNILKKEYGMDYVYLERAEDAEKMLRAVKFAKSKNMPIPENIVMSSTYPMDGQCIMNSELKTTVFINPQNTLDIAIKVLKQEEKSEFRNLLLADTIGRQSVSCSTPNDLHTILHEFNHMRNPMVISNTYIPQKHLPWVGGLMNYSRINCNKLNDEVRNELLTKRDIQGLNPNEEALLKLWG